MRDTCLISRDAGHLVKMRDCPAKCGTVDTYVILLKSVAVRKLQVAILAR